MPHFTSANRSEDAVLWEKTGVGANGMPTVGSPIEIKVRWEKRKTWMVDAQGNKQALDATAKVDRDIPVGSVMFAGSLADWLGTGTGSGGETSELYEVKVFQSMHDIKARLRSRQVGLSFYRDTLPDTTA